MRSPRRQRKVRERHAIFPSYKLRVQRFRRQPSEMIGLPIKQRIARVGLGGLVDLGKASRVQQAQVLEGIRIEIAAMADIQTVGRVSRKPTLKYPTLCW